MKNATVLATGGLILRNVNQPRLHPRISRNNQYLIKTSTTSKSGSQSLNKIQPKRRHRQKPKKKQQLNQWRKGRRPKSVHQRTERLASSVGPAATTVQEKTVTKSASVNATGGLSQKDASPKDKRTEKRQKQRPGSLNKRKPRPKSAVR